MASGAKSLRDRASREATDWFILLHEEPDDQDLQRRFEAWLKADPSHERAYAVVERVMAATAAIPVAHAAHWKPFVEARRASGRPFAIPKRRPLLWSIGAAALAASAIALALPALLMQWAADHVTGTAEVRRISLQDGSIVTVAPDSAIVVRLEKTERRVELLSGEAYFDVAADRDRPFRVAARTVEVTVLGTRFDVRRDAGGASVSVEEGAVQVGSPTGRTMATENLGPGQSIRVEWNGASSRSLEVPQLVGAWRYGQLIAHELPLSEAVDQLRRHFGGSIIIADSALAQLRVTGAYNLRDPEDALRGMARAHGANVRRVTPWLLVMSIW